jgi:hypothetical protein
MPPLRRKINQRSPRILILSFLTHRGPVEFFILFSVHRLDLSSKFVHCLLHGPATLKELLKSNLSLPSKCSIDALRCSLLPLLERTDPARRYMANTRFYSVNGRKLKISMLFNKRG